MQHLVHVLYNLLQNSRVYIGPCILVANPSPVGVLPIQCVLKTVPPVLTYTLSLLFDFAAQSSTVS